MDGYVGGADDVMKIARYNKKREQEKEKFEVPKKGLYYKFYKLQWITLICCRFD